MFWHFWFPTALCPAICYPPKSNPRAILSPGGAAAILWSVSCSREEPTELLSATEWGKWERMCWGQKPEGGEAMECMRPWTWPHQHCKMNKISIKTKLDVNYSNLGGGKGNRTAEDTMKIRVDILPPKAQWDSRPGTHDSEGTEVHTFISSLSHLSMIIINMLI